MARLRIVSINMTHSQEDKAVWCRTDEEWARAIRACIESLSPLYITPHGEDTYIRRHFIERTLRDGYIVPGIYEAETPELGKVKYGIWNERSDYSDYLFRKNKEIQD